MGRKLITTILAGILAAGVLVGCGSSSSPSSKPNPVTTELSYFPADTPFVLTLATAPNAGSVQQAQGLIGRFPAAGLGIAALEGKLSSLGLSYQNDIRPLFGHPIALGLSSTSGLGTSATNDFLAVWMT